MSPLSSQTVAQSNDANGQNIYVQINASECFMIFEIAVHGSVRTYFCWLCHLAGEMKALLNK